MSDINFQGPQGEYQPDLGGDVSHSVDMFAPPLTDPSYANPNQLNIDLQTLTNMVNVLVVDLESALLRFALPVTSVSDDIKLITAHQQEWPSQLGEPAGFITYRYYKALGQRDTASASYIRMRFEEAVRDVTGTNAIDLIDPANIILSEIELVQEFVFSNVTSLSDSSEKRIVELFQDWVANATKHTGILRNLFEAGDALLPASNTNSLDPNDASNAQSLFKVNLNQLNADIVQSLGLLKKNFSTYATIFYQNFLRPALNFRQNVTSQIRPVIPGVLGSEMEAAQNANDANLAAVLADQKRRNNIFEEQLTSIEGSVQQRDKYRSYIVQLAPIGAPVASTTIMATDTPDQAVVFNDLATQIITDATPNFSAPHSLLSGLPDPGAHPQYLLKGGDTITGNLRLDPGVLIDGLVPHTHSHTGTDGSTQVHGSDILFGTVGTGVIDTGNQPPTPYNLAVVGTFSQVVPPGVAMITLVLQWEGDPRGPNPNLSYEVQYAAVV